MEEESGEHKGGGVEEEESGSRSVGRRRVDLVALLLEVVGHLVHGVLQEARHLDPRLPSPPSPPPPSTTTTHHQTAGCMMDRWEREGERETEEGRQGAGREGAGREEGREREQESGRVQGEEEAQPEHVTRT
eukprot:2148418-Rhodomonas_salina.1